MARVFYLGGSVVNDVFLPDFMTKSDDYETTRRLLAAAVRTDASYIADSSPGVGAFACLANMDIVVAEQTNDGAISEVW